VDAPSTPIRSLIWNGSCKHSGLNGNSLPSHCVALRFSPEGNRVHSIDKARRAFDSETRNRTPYSSPIYQMTRCSFSTWVRTLTERERMLYSPFRSYGCQNVNRLEPRPARHPHCICKTTIRTPSLNLHFCKAL
jgi:hypothetical protein